MLQIKKFFGLLADFFDGRDIKNAIAEISTSAIGTKEAALYVRSVGRKKIEDMKEQIEDGNYPEKTRKALDSVVSSFSWALIEYELALQKYDQAWEAALLTIRQTFAQIEEEDDDDGPGE